MVSEFERIKECYIPKRYIFNFLGFFGLFSIFSMRANLSVAIIAMVNRTQSEVTNQSNRITECALPVEKKNPNVEFKGNQYNWDSETEGMILGAFFYSYTITQVPGGILAEKYGAKWLFGGGVLLTAILTLLTPLAVDSGIAVLVALRILAGFGEGFTLPAMNYIISQWSPLLERSRVSTMIYMGCVIGNAVSFPMSGWLSSTDLLGGWPSAFYVFGTFGCIWFVFWAVIVHNSPFEHPTISPSELAYFQMDSGQLPVKKPIIPWKAIFTSLPVWATLVAHVGHEFGFMMFFIELPNYLSSVLNFNIKESGALSAMPFIMTVVVSCCGAWIADKLRSSGILGITTIRKLLTTIGLVGPAICLIGITVSGCRPHLIVGLLILSMALNGFAYSGFHITHVDMSPSFAGTLYGITNGAANLDGMFVPAMVGAFTSDGDTLRSWNKVFYITSIIYVGSAIFFLLFASAELQRWGKEEENDERQESEVKI